jgi:hypothetical protein
MGQKKLLMYTRFVRKLLQQFSSDSNREVSSKTKMGPNTSLVMFISYFISQFFCTTSPL